MQKVRSQVVFSFLEFFFGDASLPEDGDIEGVFLALEEMWIEEVDDLAGVLPGPSSQNSGAIHCIGSHVVIQQRIKVQVGHTSHLALESSHLNFSLEVHLSDELLAILKFQAELVLLLAVEIRALL